MEAKPLAAYTPSPWFVAGLMIRKQTSDLGGSFALAKVIDHEWLEMGDTDANAPEAARRRTRPAPSSPRLLSR